MSALHRNEIISLILTAGIYEKSEFGLFLSVSSAAARLGCVLVLESSKCPRRAFKHALCSFVSHCSPSLSRRLMADPERSTSPKSSSTRRDCERLRLSIPQFDTVLLHVITIIILYQHLMFFFFYLSFFFCYGYAPILLSGSFPTVSLLLLPHSSSCMRSN